MANENRSDRSRRTTVLIVDDELLVRWAIADYLQECGYKILAASNADEAIDALQKYEPAIQVVFSDIRMPGSMDGFGLATWVKQNRPEIAVILTSGNAQAEDAARELCDHVGEIIRKPYQFEHVQARIESAIRP